jgi:hypothetical protein
LSHMSLRKSNIPGQVTAKREKNNHNASLTYEIGFQEITQPSSHFPDD